MDVRLRFTATIRPSTPPRRVTTGDWLGPDRVELGIRIDLVKPGKGKAFLRGEAVLRLTTKVRDDVVARWLLDKLFAAGADGASCDFPTDAAELAKWIAEMTQDLEPGSRWDPEDDDPDGTGVVAPLRPKPSPPSRRNPNPGE